MWREIGRQVQPRGIESENSGICGDDDDIILVILAGDGGDDDDEDESAGKK